MSKSQKYEGISNKPLLNEWSLLHATDKINSIKYLERQKLHSTKYLKRQKLLLKILR